MSKRLRASVRAANKGRNLRPRSSLVPEQVLVGAAGTPSPSEPPPSDPGGETDATAAAPSLDPSLDLRARETVREGHQEGGGSRPPAEAPELAAEPPAAEPPSEAVPSTRPVLELAPNSDTQPSKPSVVTKPIESPEPKQASEAVEAPKVAPVKPAAEVRSEAAPKAAQRVDSPGKPAAPSKEEVPLLATTLRTEQPKVTASTKAAPIKVEEPKKTQQAGSKKGEEPRKGGKAEEARSLPSNKKVAAGKDADPGSRRPAPLRAVPALDDDLDPSSVSSAFFRKDQDSVPPVEEHEDHDLMPVPVLSPSTLARRARLRRLVAGVVAFAGVISIAVVGKQVAASKRPVAAFVAEPKPTTPVREETPPQPAAEPVKPAVATEPAKADVDPKADAKPADKADDKKPDDAAKTDAGEKADEKDAKKDDAKGDDAKKADDKPAPSAADAAALKKETLSLLNRGRTKDAIIKAREAIAADATDADLYLYLGSALQDSGKWKDGIDAYSECVRTATKGPVHECRAMGGHK